MNRDDIKTKVEKIFRDIFDDEDIVISDSTCAQDIEEWDSLEQINLIVAMENEFCIKFDINDLGNLNNVGEMIDLIQVKINE